MLRVSKYTFVIQRLMQIMKAINKFVLTKKEDFYMKKKYYAL